MVLLLLVLGRWSEVLCLGSAPGQQQHCYLHVFEEAWVGCFWVWFVEGLLCIGGKAQHHFPLCSTDIKLRSFYDICIG
jgi:hypothetical protein